MMRALVFALALFGAIPLATAADGRALVVAGRVMVERAAPGAFSITALGVGTEIRSGDLIRTGSDGRAQIRFSDGAIVSLQPGTDFRIEDYRYERDQRRAFFYLLRGALRTLTGAIGKTNHDEYRMKTPTATVGVRGTEYVAEQTVCDPRCAPGPRAGLRVAVSKGRIVLLTDAGEIEVDAGQSAAAESADAPPQRIEQGPVLPPISLSQPRERTAGGSTTGSGAGQASAPGSSPSKAAAPSVIGSDREAREADHDGDGRADGAASAADTGAAGTFDPSRGEKTAPASKSSPRGEMSSDPAATTGPMAPRSAPPEGRDGEIRLPSPQARSDADAATTNSAASIEESAFVDSWPRFIATEAGPRAAAISPNERRSASGALLPVVDMLVPGAQTGFPAHGGGGGGSGSSGAGGGTGDDGTSSPGSSEPGAGLPGPDGRGVALRVLDPWRHSFGATMPDAGSVELDDEARLSAFDWCRIGALCRIARGSTNFEEADHDLWTSWGRWAGGQAIAAEALGGIPLQIAGNEGLHYLIGVPSTTIPTSGVFGYELVGATRATISGGGPTGRLGGSAAVAFSPSGARVGIDANVAFDNGGVYRFATTGGVGDPARSQLVTAAPGHGFRGDLAATGARNPVDCAGGCAARVDGGLFGPDAARVGITYRIAGSGDGSTISGVGVFGKKSPQQ